MLRPGINRIGDARRRVTGGFTIVELLVTVVIVSVLAAGAFPMAELVARRGKEQDLRRNLVLIRDALDAYKHAYDEGRIVPAVGNSGYPPSLAVLVDGVPDAKNLAGAKLYFLRRVPRDPFVTDPAVPAVATWGKRSYDSSAAEPKPGKDVYDVYSLAPGEGLNGIAYKEW